MRLNGVVLQDEIDNLESKLQREHDAKVAEAKAAIETADRELLDGRSHIQWLKAQLRNSPRNREARNQTSPALVQEKHVNSAPDTLANGIRLAAKSLNEFTADQVVDWLKGHMPSVAQGDRRAAITVMLSRLRKGGTVKIVKAGLRGQPQIYRINNDNGEAHK